jgi:hypothetical protein
MIFFKLCNGLTTTWLYCPFSWVGLGALPTHKGTLRFAKGLPIQVGSLPSPSGESSVHRSVTGSSSQLAYKTRFERLSLSPRLLVRRPTLPATVWSRRDCSGRCETLPFSLYTGKREGLFLSSSFSPPPSLLLPPSVLAGRSRISSVATVLCRHRRTGGEAPTLVSSSTYARLAAVE